MQNTLPMEHRQIKKNTLLAKKHNPNLSTKSISERGTSGYPELAIQNIA
jgi:hypothetical protein